MLRNGCFSTSVTRSRKPTPEFMRRRTRRGIVILRLRMDGGENPMGIQQWFSFVFFLVLPPLVVVALLGWLLSLSRGQTPEERKIHFWEQKEP